jgi:hypothetical protein
MMRYAQVACGQALRVSWFSWVRRATFISFVCYSVLGACAYAGSDDKAASPDSNAVCATVLPAETKMGWHRLAFLTNEIASFEVNDVSWVDAISQLVREWDDESRENRDPLVCIVVRHVSTQTPARSVNIRVRHAPLGIALTSLVRQGGGRLTVIAENCLVVADTPEELVGPLTTIRQLSGETARRIGMVRSGHEADVGVWFRDRGVLMRDGEAFYNTGARCLVMRNSEAELGLMNSLVTLAERAGQAPHISIPDK